MKEINEIKLGREFLKEEIGTERWYQILEVMLHPIKDKKSAEMYEIDISILKVWLRRRYKIKNNILEKQIINKIVEYEREKGKIVFFKYSKRGLEKIKISN